MFRRMMLVACCAAALASCLASPADASDRAYGRVWGGAYSRMDWERFYHYPYVWYPQNFYGNEYYRSADDLYYRYPPEMRIPTYNKQWHNPFPEPARYHWGHQYVLDIF